MVAACVRGVLRLVAAMRFESRELDSEIEASAFEIEAGMTFGVGGFSAGLTMSIWAGSGNVPRARATASRTVMRNFFGFIGEARLVG